MADIKLTWFYGQAAFGWSETWIAKATTVAACAPAIQGYTTLRANMLSTRVSLLGVRIAILGKQRQGNILAPGEVTELFDKGPTVTLERNGALDDILQGANRISFDQVRACLRFVLLTGPQRICFRYLCGIPDQVSKTEPAVTDFTRPPDWWTAFNTWKEFLKANFQVRVSKTFETGEDKPIVEWVTQDPAGGLVGAVLDVSTPLVVAKGQRVAVTGTRMKNGAIRSLNGVWKVASVTVQTGVSQTIFLRDSETRAIEQIKSLGKIRLVVDRNQDFDRMSPYRVGTHRRGGPFGQLRGRQRIRNYIG